MNAPTALPLLDTEAADPAGGARLRHAEPIAQARKLAALP